MWEGPVGQKTLVILPNDFNRKVRSAAKHLREICPSGQPTHEQVFESVRSVGLPVFFERAHYELDPSAKIVFLVAYSSEGDETINHHYNMVKNQLTNFVRNHGTDEV